MTTKAGERLIAWAKQRDLYISPEFIRTEAADIEAEAVRGALTDLRAAVVRLRVDEIVGAPLGYEEGWNRATAIVLAEIDKRMPGGAT